MPLTTCSQSGLTISNQCYVPVSKLCELNSILLTRGGQCFRFFQYHSPQAISGPFHPIKKLLGFLVPQFHSFQDGLVPWMIMERSEMDIKTHQIQIILMKLKGFFQPVQSIFIFFQQSKINCYYIIF